MKLPPRTIKITPQITLQITIQIRNYVLVRCRYHSLSFKGDHPDESRDIFFTIISYDSPANPDNYSYTHLISLSLSLSLFYHIWIYLVKYITLLTWYPFFEKSGQITFPIISTLITLVYTYLVYLHRVLVHAGLGVPRGLIWQQQDSEKRNNVTPQHNPNITPKDNL